MALVCGLTMLTAAVFPHFFWGDGLEVPFPLIPLWQGASGLALFLLGKGEDGTMLGTKMATTWKSQLERFKFGKSGDVDEEEEVDKGAEPLQ